MRGFSKLRFCRVLGALAAAFAITSVAIPAAAVDPLDLGLPAPSPPALEGTEQSVIGRYWALGRPRWFVSGTIEAGYAYLRPRFAFGYGQPFWNWVGLETYPLASFGGVGHYAGIAGAIPGLTARVGGRYYYPFGRSLLVPRESFNRDQIQLEEGPRADYLSLEAELVGTIPLYVGSLFAAVSGYRTLLVDEGFYLYEESLRTVMEPPYIWRGRLGYLFSVGRLGAIRFGPVAEVIGMPGRDEFVVRGGLVGSVLVDSHIEAQASFIPVLVSPDSLGLAGGDFGQLGVRYRWATGSKPDPERVRKAREQRARELGVQPDQVRPP